MLGKPSKRLRKRLEENGVRAQAKVLEVAEKGMAVTNGAEGVVSNTELALKCRLEVQPPDGSPAFEVQKRFRFPQLAVPSAGMTLAVIYDPTDHEEVILDESPEAMRDAMLAGAGIDQSMIEQAIAASQAAREQAGFSTMPGQMPGMPGMAGTPATPAADDSISQLERLAKLHESGALTDAEFAQQKARILGS